MRFILCGILLTLLGGCRGPADASTTDADIPVRAVSGAAKACAEGFVAALNGTDPGLATEFIDWEAYVGDDARLASLLAALRAEYAHHPNAPRWDREFLDAARLKKRDVLESQDPGKILADLARSRFAEHARTEFAECGADSSGGTDALRCGSVRDRRDGADAERGVRFVQRDSTPGALPAAAGLVGEGVSGRVGLGRIRVAPPLIRHPFRSRC